MFDLINTAIRRNAWVVALAALLPIFSACGAEKIIVPQLDDECPNIGGIQTSVPNGMVKDPTGSCVEPAPVKKIAVRYDKPETLTLTQGSSLPCRELALVVTLAGFPSGEPLDVSYTVAGREATCGTLNASVGEELLSGSPLAPVSGILTPGNYAVVAVVSPKSEPSLTATASKPVVVVPKHDQILAVVVDAPYPSDGCRSIWAGDDVPGSPAKNITGTCGKQYASAMTSDGKFLFYVEEGYLWRQDEGSQSPQKYNLILDGKMVYPSMIAISSDDQRIAFVGGMEGGGSSYFAFVMNFDGSGLKRLLANLPVRHYVGPNIAWIPNSRRVVVSVQKGGTVDGWDQVVETTYSWLDVETLAQDIIFVAKYGEDAHISILRDASEKGILLWSVFTTKQAIFVSMDGREVRPLNEAGTNAASPVFCNHGESVCAASATNEVSRWGIVTGVRETLFTVDGWLLDLYHVSLKP